MRIGIEQAAYMSPSIDEGLRRMKRHGYDCMDYQLLVNTDNDVHALTGAAFENRLREDAKRINGAGIDVFQVHGPWRYPPRDVEPSDREERFEKMAKSLRGTAILGSKYMIIHPMMPFGVEGGDDIDRFFEINFDHYRRLLRVAEAEGVIICLENMPFPKLPMTTPAQILAFVREINSPFLRVCLDTGHSAVCGVSPSEAVREIGAEYLATLHVHDNDGTRDMHAVPGTGVIDWTDFASALQEIGFGGVLSLECMAAKDGPGEKEAREIALADIARRLAGA